MAPVGHYSARFETRASQRAVKAAGAHSLHVNNSDLRTALEAQIQKQPATSSTGAANVWFNSHTCSYSKLIGRGCTVLTYGKVFWAPEKPFKRSARRGLRRQSEQHVGQLKADARKNAKLTSQT